MDDLAQRGHTVGAGGQRDLRIILYRCVVQRGVPLRGVRGIAGDQVEPPARQRLEPPALQEFDAPQAEHRRICSRRTERVFRDVGCSDGPRWTLTRQRQRNGSGAGAEVGDARRSARSQNQGAFNEKLCFRPWYEDGGVYSEPQGPKVSVTEYVGDRLTRGAAIDELDVPAGAVVARDVLGMGFELRAAHGKRVR